jgi:ribosomal protein S12 methylthiotransferase
MAQEKKICPYLDLPIQHVDDEILKRMGRRVRSSEIRNLIHKIRTFLPHISLRTSLIVGFPGERPDPFQALLDFVKEVEFDHLGAFKYSSEEGTPASRLSNQIPERVKEERLKKLMNLQKKISLKKYRSLVGEKVEVLVESAGGSQGNVKGRLQTQAPEIDGSVTLEGTAQPGDWVEAQMIKAFPYDVLGRIERHL